MNKNDESSDLLDDLIYVGREFLVALLIMAVFISSAYFYTGNWPPMVVVESGSMQHTTNGDSEIGAIDPGDLVFVKKISGREDVVTYVEGARHLEVVGTDDGRIVFHRTFDRETGHVTYGKYGDVIVYYKNGITADTPIIHRAMLWLEYNSTGKSFDVPSLSIYNFTGNLTLVGAGFGGVDVNIYLGQILKNFRNSGVEPHGGFITLGDHNGAVYDQMGFRDALGRPVLPVLPGWVMGKARGEIPWFGAFKLYFGDKNPHDGAGREAIPHNTWVNLWTTIAVIVVLSFLVDLAISLREKRDKEKRERDEDSPGGEANEGSEQEKGEQREGSSPPEQT